MDDNYEEWTSINLLLDKEDLVIVNALKAEGVFLNEEWSYSDCAMIAARYSDEALRLAIKTFSFEERDWTEQYVKAVEEESVNRLLEKEMLNES